MWSPSVLPSSLLSLVLCVLDAKAAAVASGNVAEHVATAMGATPTPSSTTSNLSMTITRPVASTGTGMAYAQSCNAALQAWSSSSFSYQYAQGTNVTSTFSSAMTYTSEAQGSIKVTSTTTLCDGYARVIGHTSYSSGKAVPTTYAWTNTYTTLEPNTDYPTPTPCSIQPDDCQSLSSSFDALVSNDGSVTMAPPQCNVSTAPAPTYSTGANNQTCDNCLIMAHTARLLYWPVTTAPGNLCNHRGSTITATPTGSAPNVFVTDGMTITSPSVAISFAQMSRADGCGTTIGHTIIPVEPDQVTSVRGYRALFDHRQFNFADLNWHCVSTNSTNYTIADGAGNDCYQEVPAGAYFGGLNNAAVLNQYHFRTMSKWQSTIYNNYQPQILVPNTMTKAISSIWGTSCIIHPDGVWDPPIALTPESALDLPSWGPGENTAEHPLQTTPPAPAYPYGPYSPPQATAYPDEPGVSHGEHFTALPENEGSALSGQGGDNGGSQAETAAPISGSAQQSGAGGDGASMGMAGPGNGPQASPAPTSHANANANDGGSGSGSGEDDGGAAGDHYVVNGVTCSVVSSGSGGTVLANADTTVTVLQGGSPATIASQVVSAAPSASGASAGGLVIGAGSSASTIAPSKSGKSTTKVIIGTKTLTCSRLSNGAWVVPDSSTTMTVSPGGSAMEVDTATLSAASSDLVRVDSAGSSGGSSSSAASGTASGTSGGNQGSNTGGSQSATSASQSASAASRSSIMGGVMGVFISVGLATVSIFAI